MASTEEPENNTVVDGTLLENLMLGGKSAEKPVKTDISTLPENEFDELD